jgi:nitrile hydratase
MRGVQDIGGLPAGPVDTSEHERTFFDQRVDAMQRLLTHPSRATYTVDAMRRAIESHTPEQYASLSYYEKWLNAMRMLLVEQGVLTEQEILQKIAQIGSGREAAR